MFTAEVLNDFLCKLTTSRKENFQFLKIICLKAFQPDMRVDCRVFAQDLVLHKFLRAEDHQFLIGRDNLILI